MTQALAALLGALIGGMATVAGVLVSSRAAYRLEARRIEAVRQDALARQVAMQAAEVFRLMFALEDEIHKLCWLATHAPNRVTDRAINDYWRQSQELAQQLNGAMAVLAGYDIDLFDLIYPIRDELDTIDGNVARIALAPHTPGTITDLAAILPRTVAFYHGLRTKLGSTIRWIVMLGDSSTSADARRNA